MLKIMRYAILAFIVINLSMAGSLVFAKEHGGKEHGGKEHGGETVPDGFARGEKTGWGEKNTPPGWSQGKKTGWKSAGTPPGITKGSKRGSSGSKVKNKKR